MKILEKIKNFLNKNKQINDMEKHWIIKTKLGFGVATVSNIPLGVKNKYHIAYNGIMIIDFIDDIESLVTNKYFLDGFSKHKLKNIKEKLYLYNKKG